MDIDLLRTFVAICERHSFTAAARHVGRTQSAVSLQMRRLEDSLGRALFDRSSTRVALTEHGALLLGHARRILESVGEAETAFGRGTIDGVVVLGTPEEYAPRVLGAMLGDFVRLHPSVTINLVVAESRRLARSLAEGSIDLALVTEGEGPVRGGPVVFHDRIVWVTAATAELHLRDPLPLAIWDQNEGYGRHMLRALAAMRRDYRTVVVSRSVAGLRGAATAGLAVTALMSSCIGPALRRLGAEDGFPPLATLAVRLERAHLRKSALIDRLEAHLRAGLAGPGRTPEEASVS